MPALKQRPDDIPELANHFLHSFAARQHKQLTAFHPDMQAFLQSRAWPGNIRELENFVERLVTLAPGEMTELDASILPAEFQTAYRSHAHTPHLDMPAGKSLPEQVEACERAIIMQALSDNNWNQSQAARILHVSEQTIRYKMQKLHIAKPQ